FNLCDVSDSPDGAKTYNTGETEYWYSLHYILDDPPGWNRISIPLADIREDPNGLGFDRKGWFGIEGNDILDLDQIKGFQMEFSMASTMGDIAFGTIVLDELTLVQEGWQNAVPSASAGPVSFRLLQNYPNPFNPSTSIPFTLAHESRVKVTVFDMQGRMIATVAEGRYAAGPHTVHFTAGNLPSGAYVCRIDAGGQRMERKMILTK
ncbi:T9SS type A sorting domain-containing protein, partial [bacterium]|nr:T9SS type A sorting domain-containing protein [bacterium]